VVSINDFARLGINAAPEAQFQIARNNPPSSLASDIRRPGEDALVRKLVPMKAFLFWLHGGHLQQTYAESEEGKTGL
jgi:hypothetical protein